MYEVVVDGLWSPGRPSGQVLASVTGLPMGNPSVTLTSKASPPDVAATLPFNSAVVTVGTGLTR